MGSFFNESVAASLQYVTLPLELVGLTLALIEVRFPNTAANLTRQIERLSAPVRELRSGEPGSAALMEKSLGALLARVLKAGYYVLTVVYAVMAGYQLIRHGYDASDLIGLFISYVVTGVIMTVALLVIGLTVFFLVVGGSDFARRFVAGRAIGTLGILIAGVGLLGEVYQLVTQIVR